MSETDSSGPLIPDSSETKATEVERDLDDVSVTTKSSSPDQNVRERVLKQVGLTSTAFIGPAFPPQTHTAWSDIDNTLDEFYKELSEISADALPPSPPKRSSSTNMSDTVIDQKHTSSILQTHGFQERDGHRQASWPHWYENKPYHLRRPRPGHDLNAGGRSTPPVCPRLHPPPTTPFHTPPFHKPPFHRPPHQHPRPHTNPDWCCPSTTNHYPDDFPSPNESGPRFCGWDERGHSHNPEVIYDGWSRNAQEEWDRFSNKYDRRFNSWDDELREQQRCRRSPPVLVLMRGLPGSGKSTMARELLFSSPSGLILSTDDYFAYEDGYRYEPGLLGVAHEWNQRRAEDAMRDGRSPVIIDNTNIQAWEMKPYVQMALDRGYRVDFCEPNTSWKFDPSELEKRNKHGVPQEKIAQMLDRFSFPVSIGVVMDSQEPFHVNQRRLPERPQTRTGPFPRELPA